MEVYKCEECEQISPEFYCEICQEAMCNLCDEAIHRNGKRRHHFRAILCKNCRRVSKKLCNTCKVTTCECCSLMHPDHDLVSLSLIYTTVLYWDIGNNSPGKEEIKLTLEKLQKVYPGLKKMKIFGKSIALEKNIEGCAEIEFLLVEDEADLRMVFIDISLLYHYYGHFIIVSPNVQMYKPYLMQIITSGKFDKIKCAFDIMNTVEVDVGDIVYDDKGQKSAEASKLVMTAANQDKIEAQCQWIIGHLKNMAGKGKLVHIVNEFEKLVSETLKIDLQSTQEVFDYLAEHKLITILERKYTSLLTQKTISLCISSLTIEVLSWAILSLKQDEMLPTERAIQARVKEAFDYKVSSEEWKELLDLCIKSQKNPEILYTSSSKFSLFSNNLYETTIQGFKLKKYKDLIFNNETYLIYPLNEKWLAYDKYLKVSDVLRIKETEIWKEFMNFFSQYFFEENFEAKAIPGGRYGCAQFLKSFASDILKECSVGKLNYIVQLAIDEDLLRYQKNLLVWTSCLKVPEEDLAKAKLVAVQKSLENILVDFKEGVSLAQLPGILNKSMEFTLDLQELGFAKLKDLVVSIPGVQIVKKANKHQYAVFQRPRNNPRQNSLLATSSQNLQVISPYGSY